MKLGISAYKKGSHTLAIKYFQKSKQYSDKPALADKYIQKVKADQNK
jgi:hypothetical protein